MDEGVWVEPGWGTCSGPTDCSPEMALKVRHCAEMSRAAHTGRLESAQPVIRVVEVLLQRIDTTEGLVVVLSLNEFRRHLTLEQP